MLRFVDLEDDQGPDETLLAGIKPLPVNRMMRQAGREANSFYTRGGYGGFAKGRDGQIIQSGPEGRQVPLREKNRYNSAAPDQPKVMPKDLKQRTMERLERTQDAINNWDPIEASAKEDYNRLKGKMGPADAVELIQPIAPLDGEIREAGAFPQV